MSETKKKIGGEGFWVRLIATFFFSGYLPKAPGTWASGFTIVIMYFVWPQQWYIQLTAILIVYMLGAWFAGKAEEYYGHDSRYIVIDEVAGQMVALFMVPVKLFPFLLGFILFRIFDIVKPPPVKAWESFRGGWGVMADDLAAGFYAVVILQIIRLFLSNMGLTFV
jgi:phosphatidylglycerophosphatase A